MGIDFAAASTYKWLMAERGFGLLYVAADLQGEVLPTTRWGHRQVSNFDRNTWTWDAYPGAARYETGNISEPLAAAALESVRMIREIGVDAIQQHSQDLVARLRQDLEPLGYECLTPEGTKTPIIAFHLPDPGDAFDRLKAANVLVTISRSEQRMRVSPSVFNDHGDVDRLVAALS